MTRSFRSIRQREAAKTKDPQYQLNLVNFPINLGKRDNAEDELAKLRKRARQGNLDIEISTATRRLDTVAGDPK